MLQSENYVRLIAIDFSKAFDSIRLQAVFAALALLPIPDFLFNWLVQFLTNRSHSTSFRGILSPTLTINSSIVQGSGLGPVVYTIAAAGLKPKNPPNLSPKYADDTYLLIPASSDHTADSEVAHITEWAALANLTVNITKCREIILHRRAAYTQPPFLASQIPRVTELKILGVLLQDSFSMSSHILSLIKRANQTLYALKVVKAHGLAGHSLHSVTRAHLETRLTYAISAWVGFATQEGLNRLQKVVNKATRWGLGGGITLPTIQDLAAKSDKRLFSAVLCNPAHVLRSHLPGDKPQHYDLRTRPHNQLLSQESLSLRRNFIHRMLFLKSY